MIDRRTFSQKKRAEIVLRQGGNCRDCGEKLQPSRFQIDHRQALIHDGDNSDENLAAVCDACHRIKTKKDVHARAHADRVAVVGRQRRGPPMPGSRNSRFKKHMDGRTSYR